MRLCPGLFQGAPRILQVANDPSAPKPDGTAGSPGPPDPADSITPVPGLAPEPKLDATDDPPAPAQSAAPAAQAPSPSEAPAPRTIAGVGTPAWVVAAALLVLSAAALILAWNTQQRVQALEAELVKRQESSGTLANEARSMARQAEISARESAAKVALMEARVAETTVQRGQLEELLQSLARSRDENVLADVDAAIRVAMQQAAITGTAEPLVLTLRQVDERLARYNQPRLEVVRRSVAQDLERIRTASVTDVAVLTIRVDEVLRIVDELPLLSAPQRSRKPRAGEVVAPDASSAGITGKSDAARAEAAKADSKARTGEPQSPATAVSGWSAQLAAAWQNFSAQLWDEARDLVRVTRIDDPEAMLVAPEQAFFLRENLKLRLLNARLALLSRQFELAQSDLRDARLALDRYFDRSARQVSAASETLRLVAAQARQVAVPRPDATLAAIATASAGR